MRIGYILSIAIGLLALWAGRAFSYPTMIAHGYTSCSACHVSPTGGGLLTPYGRSLSREVLSQSGLEGEENALYGVLAPPSWIQLGGDVRVLQNYMNSKMVEAAKLVVMQADAELGVVTEHWQAVGTLGYQNPMSANATKSPILSRRHFVQYSNGTGDFVRAGKFDLSYGIRWPDHVMLNRRDFGWDEGSEAYRVEWTQLRDQWEGTASASIGRPDAPELLADRNLSLRLFRSIGETNQVGLSFYYGSNDKGPRALAGPAFAVTALKNLTLFGQVDGQKLLGENRGERFGIVESLRVNYELFKGVHLFVLQEYSRLNWEDTTTAKEAYTGGFQWFVRPHIELGGAIRTLRTAVAAVGSTDSAWMMMHYYL